MGQTNVYLCTALVALTLFLEGCSTAHKRAEKYLEAQAYDDAASTFEEILREDPKDADAVIGLQVARNKIIDTKLIQIRLSRMAGNQQNAIDMLLNLVDAENSWKLYPKGQVAFTQAEESSLALSFLKTKVKEYLAKKHPLPADIQLKRYRPIFEGDLVTKFSMLQGEVQKYGRNRCENLSSEGSSKNLPYYAYFIRRFCAYWGGPQRETASTDDSRLAELFGRVEVTLRIKGIPQELSGVLTETLRDSFSDSPWYDPKGKKTVRVILDGDFLKRHEKEAVRLVHQYTEQVPYTAYVPVMQSRQVPYSSSSYQCDTVYGGYGQSAQVCGYVPVTKYRTEYYTETVAVTQYREVPRTQPYEADKHYQFLGLLVKGRVEFGSYQKVIEITEKSEETSFQHDWNLPEIGLTPKALELPDPLDWLKDQGKSVATQTAEAGSQLWTNLFCKPQVKDRSIASQGDQVHRCLKQHLGDPPKFAEKWYDSIIGQSVRETKDALALDDL